MNHFEAKLEASRCKKKKEHRTDSDCSGLMPHRTWDWVTSSSYHENEILQRRVLGWSSTNVCLLWRVERPRDSDRGSQQQQQAEVTYHYAYVQLEKFKLILQILQQILWCTIHTICTPCDFQCAKRYAEYVICRTWTVALDSWFKFKLVCYPNLNWSESTQAMHDLIKSLHNNLNISKLDKNMPINLQNLQVYIWNMQNNMHNMQMKVQTKDVCMCVCVK